MSYSHTTSFVRSTTTYSLSLPTCIEYNPVEYVKGVPDVKSKLASFKKESAAESCSVQIIPVPEVQLKKVKRVMSLLDQLVTLEDDRDLSMTGPSTPTLSRSVVTIDENFSFLDTTDCTGTRSIMVPKEMFAVATGTTSPADQEGDDSGIIWMRT